MNLFNFANAFVQADEAGCFECYALVHNDGRWELIDKETGEKAYHAPTAEGVLLAALDNGGEEGCCGEAATNEETDD